MVYAKVIDGEIVQYPWSWEQMRAENPEVLFPDTFVESIFAEYGAVVVEYGTQPSVDAMTQELEETTPTLVDGVWMRSWNVVALSAERQAEMEQNAREANRLMAKQALLDTDWSELPSVRNTGSMPHLLNADAFDAYRAVMRQIALNPPIEVDEWPAKPDGVWSSTS